MEVLFTPDRIQTGNLQITELTESRSSWWNATIRSCHRCQIEALRINDFLALIATDRKDYRNNGVASTHSSRLKITTDFYIGGVPASFRGLPFTSQDDIAVSLLESSHKRNSPHIVLFLKLKDGVISFQSQQTCFSMGVRGIG